MPECGSSAVPAGDRHPLGFVLHPAERFVGYVVVELDAAPVIRPPYHLSHAVERAHDDQYVVAWRRKIAGVEPGAARRNVRDDDRARASEPERGTRERYRLAFTAAPAALRWDFTHVRSVARCGPPMKR